MVYDLLVGLLCFTCQKDLHVVLLNFLDVKYPRFVKLRCTMNTCFQQWWKDGIGAEVKHSTPTNSKGEDQFWNLGILHKHIYM